MAEAVRTSLMERRVGGWAVVRALIMFGIFMVATEPLGGGGGGGGGLLVCWACSCVYMCVCMNRGIDLRGC